jgi:hypothetical protein
MVALSFAVLHPQQTAANAAVETNLVSRLISLIDTPLRAVTGDQ